MTLQEMLEAAQLDALGMLEGDDRQAFEAAFDAAAPAIQEQVRAEQTRCAMGALEYSDAVPPAALRERVLGTIGAEIQADAHLGAAAEVPEAMTHNHLAQAAVATGIVGRMNGQPRTPQVSPAWRATSLGFATAAAILLAAFFSMSREMDTLQHKINNDADLGRMSKGFGGDVFVEAMFGKDVQRFAFAAAPGVQSKAAATLLLLPGMNEARLFVKDLAVGPKQTARVLLLDDAGNIVSQLSEFAMDQKITTIDKLGYEATKGRHLAIAVANEGAEATLSDIRLVVHAA